MNLRKIFILLLTQLSSMMCYSQFDGGNGTSSNPYLVSNAQQLAYVADNVSAYFRQTCDIDLSEYINENSTKGWFPIGTNYDPFTGIYDGNGFKITGLTINRTSDYLGLFGYTKSATIKNITIIDARVSGGDKCGILVGCADNSKITNILVHGDLIGKSNIGGISGELLGSTLDNSEFSGNIIGTDNVGGITGYNCLEYVIQSAGTATGTGYKEYTCDFSNSKTIKNNIVHNTTIHGNNNIGGITGYNYIYAFGNNTWGSTPHDYETFIMNVSLTFDLKLNHFAGKITGDNCIGGIIGKCKLYSYSKGCNAKGYYMDGYTMQSVYGETYTKTYVVSKLAISNCSAIGFIKGISSVGGLVGLIDGSRESEINGKFSPTNLESYTQYYINQCATDLSIVADKEYAGGILGYVGYLGTRASSMANISSTGSIAGSDYVGGLVGKHNSFANISNGLSSAQIYGRNHVGGIIGLGDRDTKISTSVTACPSISGMDIVYRIGEASSYVSNKSSLNTKLYLDGTEVEADENNAANGTSISDSQLNLGNTYHSMQWDMAKIWKIKEEETLPYLRSQTDTPLKNIIFESIQNGIRVTGELGSATNFYIQFHDSIYTNNKTDKSWNVDLINASENDTIKCIAWQKNKMFSIPTNIVIKGIQPKPILPDSILLNVTDAKLKVSEKLQLVSTIFPENSLDKSVRWKSSDDNIATVDNNGLVTANSIGECIITSTSVGNPNISSVCIISVIPTLIESISISPDIWVGETNSYFQINATILPDNATNKSLEWSSSNEEVATVDSKGFVYIRKDGNCEISAKTLDGSNLETKCIITSITNVENIFPNNELIDVYSLHGVLIKSRTNCGSLKQLSSGVYLVRLNKRTHKIILR